MKLTSKLLMISASTLLGFGSIAPAFTANAASVKTASRAYQNSKIKANYRYAKNLMIKNKTGLSGQSSSIFSKKLNPDTGATAGYSDLLLGLKGNGYKFNTKEKTLLRKNLVIKKTTPAATMANAVMAVQAMGLNARDYKPYGHKKGINLVTKLYRTSVSKQTTSAQAQVLIAISMSSKFKQPKGAKFSKASLSARLVKAQLNNHGWAYNNQQGVRDADTTSMVLTGLARGKVNTTNVKDSLLKGQKFLTGIVQPSGAFGYTFNGKTTPNANSTAEAIIALSNDFGMKKYVNNTAMKTSQTRTPLYAMLTYVNKSGSIKNAATQLYGVGQVNLAVAAYKAALKNRSVYTIN